MKHTLSHIDSYVLEYASETWGLELARWAVTQLRPPLIPFFLYAIPVRNENLSKKYSFRSSIVRYFHHHPPQLRQHYYLTWDHYNQDQAKLQI